VRIFVIICCAFPVEFVFSASVISIFLLEYNDDKCPVVSGAPLLVSPMYSKLPSDAQLKVFAATPQVSEAIHFTIGLHLKKVMASRSTGCT